MPAASASREAPLDQNEDRVAVYERSEEIARLEAEIEELQDAADRATRIMHLSRAASAIGAGTFLYALYAGWGVGLLGGISLALGGIVLFGSTRSTRQQLRARASALEQQRSDLIDGLGLSPAFR